MFFTKKVNEIQLHGLVSKTVNQILMFCEECGVAINGWDTDKIQIIPVFNGIAWLKGKEEIYCKHCKKDYDFVLDDIRYKKVLNKHGNNKKKKDL